MCINYRSLQGITQSVAYLGLACIQVDLDALLTISHSNALFSEMAKEYGLSQVYLFPWIRNEKYYDIANLVSVLNQKGNIDGETEGYSEKSLKYKIKWSLTLCREDQLICFIRDIRSCKRYQEHQSLFESLLSAYHSSVVVTDENNKIIIVNDCFEEISGYQRQEVLGLDPSFLGSEKQDALFYKELWCSLKNDGFWSGVVWNKKKDGREYPEQKTIRVVNDSRGKVINYYSISDVLLDAPDQSDPKNVYRDLISPQTLVNALNDSVRRTSAPVAVFHIGVDNMFQAKQLYGLAFSDSVVKILLEQLKKTFLPRGLICWSIGNEVIVAANHVNTPDMAHLIGCSFLKDLNAITHYDEVEWEIKASLGVAFCSNENEAWKTIEQSHIAMHHAKEIGGNNLQFYDIQTQSQAKKDLDIEKALRVAIQNQEFLLHYQPIVDLKNYVIYGAEALIRWQSATLGSIPPDQFIPIAEQSDLILDIGFWVFQTVCQQLCEWGEKYTGSIAVNLSANQIQYAELPSILSHILQQYSIPVERIHLEITETAMINDINSAASVLAELQGIGFSLSIDDFGTGYSSLSYLTRLPVNKLKIDRSFIDTISSCEDSLVVIKAIIGLAKGLGLSVVAEGLESFSQMDMLIDLQCDFAQGYLLSKPLDAEKFIEYIQYFYDRDTLF